ncbi:MAG: tRNA pseudouridine(55) synthase TruB [Chloroflexota bacterium]
MAEPFGFLNIHKAQGMTSHDVVAKVRRGLKIKKVGHAGTLDPLATGVLVVCLGGATRLSEYVMQSTKRYRARVYLGATTDTYDAEGEVQLRRDASYITRADVESTLAPFLGDIQQIPPMYSAIKQGGRKLYDLARAGDVVEREPRAVRIDSLEIMDWSPPEFTLDVTCSAGTYIRSLAYDLGESLGVGAHLSGLSRLASGRFKIEDALTLDDLLTAEDWMQFVIPPQTALAGWPAVHLTAEYADHILHGRAIQYPDSQITDLAFAYAPDGQLMAIVQAGDGLLRPHKVFL